MQAHAGHIAENLEESETIEKSVAVALCDTHEEKEEAVREFQRSRLASGLTEFSTMVKTQQAEKQIATLMRPSQLALDICDQHFLCRIAKKLGCQFCDKK